MALSGSASDVDDRLTRFRVLASAIGARPLEVASTKPGAPGWTDGATIYLDPTATREDQLRTLAVQASLLAVGSLRGDLVTELRSRRGAARRYLAVEGHRALVANQRFLPVSVVSVIDRSLAERVASPEASLALALTRVPIPDPPPEFGVLRPRQLAGADEATIPRLQASSVPSPSHGRGPTDLDAGAEDDEGDEDDGYLGDLLSSPVGGGGAIGRLLARLLSSARQRGAGGPPGADASTHRGTARTVSGGVLSVYPASSPLDDPAGGRRRGHLRYPEWDVHRNRYRPDWCTVVESTPAPQDLRWIPLPDGVVFRRPLAPLGTGLVPCRRRPQGDDVDVDAAVEAYVDAAAGFTPDDEIYVESLRRKRDLSVQILLDVSGSAAEPGPGDRSIHEHQRWVAGALATALHDVGDRVALHAFNSHGRASVRVIRIKSFDDALDSLVARRLGGLVPGAYTRLGAAIRHGTASVEAHGGTARRLLVVLSDGFAYDHGYEGHYGEADARRALAEARHRGVGCLCLSIGAGTEAATLRRVFGSASHASVRAPAELVPTIGPLFRAALLAADSKRRVHQREARTRARLGAEARRR